MNAGVAHSLGKWRGCWVLLNFLASNLSCQPGFIFAKVIHITYYEFGEFCWISAARNPQELGGFDASCSLAIFAYLGSRWTRQFVCLRAVRSPFHNALGISPITACIRDFS
ncbi:MAG: hypothetical protein K2W93_20185, partial [Burkholderiaceae bacterium]|nr:hypothetical protein [Burkholderiaceae bacterium]